MKKIPILTLLKQAVSEAVGAGFLTLAVGVASLAVGVYPGYESLYVPAAIALALTIMVYALGKTSGAHCNPAVTLGLLVINKIKPVQAVVYIVAQIIGAIIGLQLAKYLIGHVPLAPKATEFPAFIAEAIGAFLLVLTVTKVVLGDIAESASGLAIGGSLLLGITISQVVSGGVLNPAIAIALGSFHLSYILGPIVGGLIGAGLGRYLHNPETE